MNYCRKEFHLTRCMGSRSPPVIDRIGSCISPTVLTVQRKEISNIFFKNRLWRRLTKITKISNICYFWRISSLSLSSNIAFKTHYVFFAIAGQVKQSCVCNASNASNVSIPMLQMKVCFLWTPWKEFKVHLESKLFWNKPSLFLRWHQL